MYKLLVLASLLLVLPLQAIAEGTVISTSFYSEAMGQEKSVRIYLPEEYETQGLKRYPVIYYLHGAGLLLEHDDFLDLTAALDIMIADGDIKPLVVVCPNGFASPYPAAFYTSSILYGDLEGYMVDDLIEWIDGNFRTIPRRRTRAVMGHSMGGYGALKFYGEHSDLYCAAAAVCGSGLDLQVLLAINLYGVLGELTGPPYIYDPLAGFANAVLFSMAGAFSPNLSNPYGVDLPLDEWGDFIPEVWALWMEHNLPQLMQGLMSDCSGDSVRIYFDAGTLDQFYILPACNAFADSLDLMGIDYEYQIFVGGHFDKLHERFPIALDFLNRGIRLQSCDYENSGMEYASVQEPGSVIGFHSSVREEEFQSSVIIFDLHNPGNVVLDVYDTSGRKIETLMDNSMSAGLHSVALEDTGLSTGVYFYSIQTQGETVTGKILMLR